MTLKEELKKRLNSLNDKGFIKYLMQTGWCMREIWELSIEHDWTDTDIEEELNFLRKEKIGTIEDIIPTKN